MFRTFAVLGALALFATTVNAQPRSLPLSPGVMPASPFGPGMPFRPTLTSPNQPGLVLVPMLAPWGYPSYPAFGFGLGGGGGFGYPFGGFGYPSVGYPPVGYPPVGVAQSVEPQPPDQTTTIALAKEFPATLTVQFPGTAEVWLDGKKVEGTASEERVLKSPVLKEGEKYTFAVKGRWTTGGKTYEAKRSVTLSAGDRSRLLVVSGEEVKE
ncbi:MAG: TIGR03000 domain-containing protein [Planctomycetes bacterium]|nr:TIGR03000 domain-containing protein [Planctomycetota bacterium]